MLWFSVWTLLVIGTLVGAFFLGGHVYRSGRALITEAGRAAELAAVLADRVTELETTAQERPAHPAPTEVPDPHRPPATHPPQARLSATPAAPAAMPPAKR